MNTTKIQELSPKSSSSKAPKSNTLEQLCIREILQRKYTEVKNRNPAFSKRSFAKKLGISSGSLSSILQGERRISKALATNMADTLGLAPDERHQFLSPFQTRFSFLSRFFLPITYKSIQADFFKIISDWEHFAILNLAKLDVFKSDARWIASQLNLPLLRAQAALDRLLSLNFLRIDNEGNIKRSEVQIQTADNNTTKESIRRSFEQGLDLAKKNLFSVVADKREYTQQFMAIDPAKLPEARTLIRQFQEQLLTLLETGTKKQVYNFSLQLYPVSKSLDEAT